MAAISNATTIFQALTDDVAPEQLENDYHIKELVWFANAKKLMFNFLIFSQTPRHKEVDTCKGLGKRFY